MSDKTVMAGEYQEPAVEEIGEGSPFETVERHPSYSQIVANRVSVGGGKMHLYGSDFGHNHYVTIGIYASELHRGLARDWAHSRQRYIEVALSEAQWAQFVSSMNVGSGTQCTKTWDKDGPTPQIPSPPDRKSQFGRELKERFKMAADALKSMRKTIESGSTSKKRLLDDLGIAERNLAPNQNWVAESFDEHMEQTVERAKGEVNAYVLSTINRAGLAALALEHGDASLLEIEGPADA